MRFGLQHNLGLGGACVVTLYGARLTMRALEGKVAIVTGSGRGIGRAVALKLASRGRGGGGQRSRRSARAGGDRARFAASAGGRSPATAASPRRISPSASSRPRSTGLAGSDIIVNNAGYTRDGVIHKQSDEQFQAMLDVHVTAPFRILRAAAEPLRAMAKAEAAEGREVIRKVVNISSISGVNGNAGQVSYASAKSAVIGMTRTLAKEWGRLKVCVNCVAFGFIETRLNLPGDHPDARAEIEGRQLPVRRARRLPRSRDRADPLGRPGTPEEAAGGVYFFVPESDYVSGQTLLVAGGLGKTDGSKSMTGTRRLVDPELLDLLELWPAVTLDESLLPMMRAPGRIPLGEVENPERVDKRELAAHSVATALPTCRCCSIGPRGARARCCPASIRIHGGGYVGGAAVTLEPVHRHLVEILGCALVSVDYRLAPETPFPGPLEDCSAGLAWLHAHAAELEIDPARIGIRGESAGGGLAAALALLVRDRGDFTVAFQQLVYSMLDDRTCTAEPQSPCRRVHLEFGQQSLRLAQLSGDRAGRGGHLALCRRGACGGPGRPAARLSLLGHARSLHR